MNRIKDIVSISPVIGEENPLHIIFTHHGFRKEIVLTRSECVMEERKDEYWASFTFEDCPCPYLKFPIGQMTLYITGDVTDGSPTLSHLELLIFWDDSYEVGEMVQGQIFYYWEQQGIRTVKRLENHYRGSVPRLGVDVAVELLPSLIK